MAGVRNTKHSRDIGERIVRKYSRNAKDINENYVRGHWDEKNGEFSILFYDGTDFTFGFSEDGSEFSVEVNPSSGSEKLEDFVRDFVLNDDIFDNLLSRVKSKKSFPKYSDRIKLKKDAKPTDSRFVYRITSKMPDSYSSIDETIEDYVLRRFFSFIYFKRR